MATHFSETDLYDPIRDYLEAEGYTVQGEVRKCDIAALRGDELVVVEMKLRLNGDVLAQAARRQEISDQVYVAIHRPKALRTWRKRAAGLLYLLRRLELGLMLVAPTARKRPKIEIEVPPALFDRAKDGALRAKVRREARQRRGDYNKGGSVNTKLLNARRERALHIACCLERFGPLTLRQLHRLGTGLETREVIERSVEFDGWFRQVAERTYALSSEGEAALNEFSQAAEHFRALLGEQALPT